LPAASKRRRRHPLRSPRLPQPRRSISATGRSTSTPTVLEDFTRQTGIKVIYSTYDSNEALYAKMKLTDEGGCDVVVPSTYFISKMAKEGLLTPLDKAKLPNFSQPRPGPAEPGLRPRQRA
jgi:spermidine/putrescine-binding protein